MLKFNNSSFTKPKDGERLQNRILGVKKRKDEALRKRNKKIAADGIGRKRFQLKYEDGIDRVKDHPYWKAWTSLRSSANQTINFNERIFRKDVPEDSEKLMTRIINTLNKYDRNASRKEEAYYEMNQKQTAEIMLSLNAGVIAREQSSPSSAHATVAAMGNGAEYIDTSFVDSNIHYDNEVEYTNVDDSHVNIDDNNVAVGNGAEYHDTSLVDSIIHNDVNVVYNNVDDSNVQDMAGGGDSVAELKKNRTELKKQAMNRMLTHDKELMIESQFPKEVFTRLMKGRLSTFDIDSYTDYVKSRDVERQSLFCSINFIMFDKNSKIPSYTGSRCKPKDNIFKFRRIFISI